MTGLPNDILSRCADAYLTTPYDIIRGGNARNVGRARAAAVFVLRECRQTSKITFDRIAEITGRSDGKSVWYWWERANALRASDPRFRLMTDALLAVTICPPAHAIEASAAA